MSLFVAGEQAITLIAKYSILEANVNHSDIHSGHHDGHFQVEIASNIK